jgi:hypothetical protein
VFIFHTAYPAFSHQSGSIFQPGVEFINISNIKLLKHCCAGSKMMDKECETGARGIGQKHLPLPQRKGFNPGGTCQKTRADISGHFKVGDGPNLAGYHFIAQIVPNIGDKY